MTVELSTSGCGQAAAVGQYAWDTCSKPAETWPQALLRTACAGSAGVVVLVAGYGPCLPHVGTSPAIVDQRFLSRADSSSAQAAAAAPVVRSALGLPVDEQTRELLAALSLNKSQLSEVLRISRPTLYDWLGGKEPNVANSRRLAGLLELLSVAGVSSSAPLNARFVRQASGSRGVSLLDALCADPLDEELVASLLREAKALGEQAESKRTTREERLRALGFEEPSEEQRRAQLAENVALNPWPKD